MHSFEDIRPVSHDEAISQFFTQVPEVMAKTLIALGLHDEDWRWVQQQCVSLLSHDSELVVSAAILSIGHSARVNGLIDRQLVIPALQAIADDSRYTGKVQDVLDDIDTFIKRD